MSKRIILTGGGTGGHITPLIAVAHELKKQNPDTYIIYVGERNGKYAALTKDNPDIDEIRCIFAGKLRRYHGESWLRRIFDIKTNLLNLRDLFLFGLGFLQALVLVKRLRPDVILLKGGFVGVPVGLAAALWKKPFITHDSDTVPGLANRVVSRWAQCHATGMPPEYYPYPKKSIRFVGVLVGKDYEHVTHDLKQTYREQLGLSKNAMIILVTGGSGGAASINSAIRSIASELLSDEHRYIVHQVGIGKASVYKGYAHERLKVHELLRPMYAYTGAADVIVTRAGANTMAELGIQAKACIVLPNPLLTGGHQLMNAAVWKEHQAAEILDETLVKSDPTILLGSLNKLLDDSKQRQLLGANLEKITVTNAAKNLAALLLKSSQDETTKA